MSWLERIDEREARRIARTLKASALETRDAAQDHLAQFASQARAIAKPALHDATEFARSEGAMLARAAAVQAGRASRAVKADPTTAVIGAVGVALIASLLFGRRRT
ncbi:MAG: hypothetical protein ABIQ30_09305 [Devosia sp.]